MAPVNVDVAEVEAQLSAIRRRRNGLAAQRALAGAVSAALIGASLMVATALRGSTSLFVLATALAASGTAACVGYVAWLTWHDWLSLPATAHLADTRAALDDRLTTLLAVAPVSPAPPLRPLLLDQVVDARQRWGVEALAPQRISPWLALVPLALAAFAATTFYARPPAAAATRRPVDRTSAIPAAPLAGAAVAPRSAQELFTKDRGDNTPASATGAAATTRAAPSGVSTAGEESAAAAGSSPFAGTAAGDTPTGGALDKLRQSIQDTFGTTPDAGGRQRGAGTDATNRGDQGTADNPRPDGTSSTTAQTADAQQRPATSSPRGQQADAANHATAGTQGARGNGRGGAANGGTAGVLGPAGAPRQGSGKTAPMAIKLSAITGVSPSQTEPQRRNDVPAEAANASRISGPLPALADEQLADATVQPLDVGPEHEGIIRRIFTRE